MCAHPWHTLSIIDWFHCHDASQSIQIQIQMQHKTTSKLLYKIVTCTHKYDHSRSYIHVDCHNPHTLVSVYTHTHTTRQYTLNTSTRCHKQLASVVAATWPTNQMGNLPPPHSALVDAPRTSCNLARQRQRQRQQQRQTEVEVQAELELVASRGRNRGKVIGRQS